MVPTTYTELFIFLLGAVGAALLLGTGAALWRYRRTGTFPGQGAAGAEPAEGRTRVRAAVMRCLGGALVLAWAIALLAVVRS